MSFDSSPLESISTPFVPGEKVSVKRKEGPVENDWTVAGRDMSVDNLGSEKVFVAKRNPGGDGCSYKSLSISEIEEWNPSYSVGRPEQPLRLEGFGLRDFVGVRRSNMVTVESDWEVRGLLPSNITGDVDRVIVQKRDGPKVIQKIVSAADLKETRESFPSTFRPRP